MAGRWKRRHKCRIKWGSWCCFCLRTRAFESAHHSVQLISEVWKLPEQSSWSNILSPPPHSLNMKDPFKSSRKMRLETPNKLYGAITLIMHHWGPVDQDYSYLRWFAMSLPWTQCPSLHFQFMIHFQNLNLKNRPFCQELSIRPSTLQ